MERVAPARITTIVPGLVIMKTICRYVGVQRIQVVKNGVREVIYVATFSNKQDKYKDTAPPGSFFKSGAELAGI